MAKKHVGFWMSVDPGLSGTGYAVWGRKPLGDREKPNLIEAGILKCSDPDYVQKLRSISEQFADLVTEVKPVVCFLEEPSFFQSAGGQVSASSGSLVKLSFLVGALFNVVEGSGFLCKLVPVNTWKGQLPKTLVAERIQAIMRRSFVSHEYDAVGIGLHMLGKF